MRTGVRDGGRMSSTGQLYVQISGSPAAFVLGQMGRARGILTYAIYLITLSSELRLHVTPVCYFFTGVRDHSGEPA